MDVKAKTYKLKKVIIKGYKSIDFQHPVELNLTDINILLGPNGAGKSNIISFFKMLGHMMSSSFGKYVEMEGTSNSILHFGAKRTPVIEGELTFINKASTVTYQFELSNANPDRLIISRKDLYWQNKDIEARHKVNLALNFKESAIAECSDSVARSIYRLLTSCKVYQFHDSSPQGPLRQPCQVLTCEYLQSNGDNLPSFLLFLKQHYTNAFYRIENYVREVIPQFNKFILEPVGNTISLRWIDNSASDYVFNAYHLSDGSIRYIALAALLLQPPETMPNIIIIDEPELGLHPYAISQLSEMVKDASLHTQVILSTQSKDLVDFFDIENVFVIELDHKDEFTKVTKLDESRLHEWLKHYSLSELWDKNIIGGRPV